MPPPMLTPRQLSAVEALALGQSVTEAANTAGVSRQTVHNWQAQPDFVTAVADLRAQTWERVQQQVYANLWKALQIESRALDSAPHGPTVALAERVIERMLGSILAARSG